MDSRLKNLPIAFFSTVMGLSGLAIALQRAGELWAPAAALGNFMALLSGLVFGLLLLVYGLKALRHWPAVIDELSDPVKMSFGATVSVSLLLLSITTLHSAPTLSQLLWATGRRRARCFFSMFRFAYEPRG